MGRRLFMAMTVWLGVALVVWVFISRMPLMDRGFSSGPPAPPGPESGPSPNTQMAVELSAAQRQIAEFLASAQNVEFSDSQLSDFEALLTQVYASPLKGETQASLARYEKTLPLFTESEEALFGCLRKVKADPAACEPTPRYRKLLKEGVAGGEITQQEADKYLDILKSMKDPAKRPALPDGGLDFMQKESAMRVRNFQKIVAAVKRVEQTSRN